MKHYVKLLAAFAVFFIPSLLVASQKHTSLELTLRHILNKSGLDASKTSIVVSDASTENILADINGNTLRNPASCAKIVTASAILSLLGPNYTLTTDFLSSSVPHNGTVDALYVRGTGDPFLVIEELWKIAHDLTLQGIHTVHDIIIDNSFFEKNEYPRMEGESRRAYAALASPFAVNFNSIAIRIAPGAVRLDPPLEMFRLINRVKTGSSYRLDIETHTSAQGEEFIVSGIVPEKMEEKILYRNIPDPVAYGGGVLRLLLSQQGVKVTGKIREGKTPMTAHLLLRHPSKPLSLLVRDMNKFSNNFTAEQLVKHLGATKKGTPGTTAKGIAVLQEYLSSLGIPKSEYTIENGSGFSSITRFSAAHMVKILLTSYHDFRISPDFVASLSIFGNDGTMKSWNHHETLQGVLRAKTGSLNGVSSLAGFVPQSNGNIRAFAILGDRLELGPDKMHQFQLDVVSAIAHNP